jgi:DNA-binding transcriptional LysR family regulator
MTLEQLRIFVAVAERQHVTDAARSLNMAQSAASHAIASLEMRHDTKLFDRVGRRIELTEAGRSLLSEARTILTQVERAELALSEFGKLERGTLKVQASQTIASYWLPRHLVVFRQAHPRIDIRLSVGNTAQVAEAVESGAVELGFVEGAVKGDQFVSVPIARDQLVLVVRPNHPWAQTARLTARNLLESVWVLREHGSGTRSVFEQALTQLGIEPSHLRVVMELPSNEAVRAAVEAGLGATALSASVAAPSIESALLHHVPFRLPQREFHVLYHAQRYRSRIADALLSKIPTGFEVTAVCDSRSDGRGRDHAYPRHGLDAAAHISGTMMGVNSAIQRPDLQFQRSELTDHGQQRLFHRRRKSFAINLVRDDLGKPRETFDLGNEAELGKMGSERVDQLRAIDLHDGLHRIAIVTRYYSAGENSPNKAPSGSRSFSTFERLGPFSR